MAVGLARRGPSLPGLHGAGACPGHAVSPSHPPALGDAPDWPPPGQFDELVWDDLCTLLAEPEPLATAVSRAHGGAWLPQELLARRKTLRRGQAHPRQQLERLTDAYLRAVIPPDEYERRRRDLEQRVQALAGQEEQLRSDAVRQQQLAGIAVSLEAFRGRVQPGLAQASFEQRRQRVLLLTDCVVVTDADVETRYVLPTSSDSEHVRFCHLRKDYFDDPALGQHHELAGIRALDDPDVDLAAHPAQPGLEQQARVAAIGIQLAQERMQAEQGRHQGHAAVTALAKRSRFTVARGVLDVGGMDDGVQQQPLRVHKHMALLALDLLPAS